MRTLAERDDALALAALPDDAAGELSLADARFAVLGSLAPTVAAPASPSSLAPDAALAEALKVLARDLMLPAVKEIWPTAGKLYAVRTEVAKG